MYTIGQISKLVNITPNALRYYDEISLVKPSEQDKFSGYRYYTKEQVKDLLLIQEYKYYGFSLNEIKDLLNQNEKALLSALTNKLKILQENYEDEGMRIKIIQRKLSDLNMKNDITRKDDMDKLILLVEDVAFERMLMKEILVSHGFTNIVECSNGKEAVEKYDKVHPDLVVTGITMPIMDGLYAMKLIKEKHKEAKAIFCSYMSQLFILPIALKSNACFDFIPKPIEANRLISSIIKAFELQPDASINLPMDPVLIDSIEQDMAQNQDDFFANYRLNQKEADAFFEITAMEEYHELRKKLKINKDNFSVKSEDTDDYNLFRLIKGNNETVDFQEVGFHIALQKEVNRQLIKELSGNDIRDFAVDFVNPHVINDYIISNDSLNISLCIGKECIGGLIYPKTIKSVADRFMNCFIMLQNKAIKGLDIQMKQEVLPFMVQTECILSTFLDSDDNKLSLFIRNDIY